MMLWVLDKRLERQTIEMTAGGGLEGGHCCSGELSEVKYRLACWLQSVREEKLVGQQMS